MNIEHTPDGIPVITLTDADMDAPAQPGFFAALDQVVANANARLFPQKADDSTAVPADLTPADPAAVAAVAFLPTPDLPTTAGLYVVDQPHHHDTPDWWIDSAVFRLTRTGYWSIDERGATPDEVAAILRPRSLHLVPLIPKTEADL